MRECIFTIFCLFSLNVSAWMCPGNFNQVGIGDTIEQVKQQCGQPVAENASMHEPNVPQEWKFFIAVNQPYRLTYSPSNNPPPRATIRMTVTFVNDKAVNIMVEEQSLTSTSLCGPTINTGDSQKSIERSCGKPVFIQKADTNAKPTPVTELIYSTAPPNTFIFENGRLKDRR
ncbi:MAG TPA: hypothetical protein VHM20_06670 [Gammaproteobacteria bacterium]|jgi:hypothetical protein|nr:hypothetical protein [Gammaproteobacteria bacterium]